MVVQPEILKPVAAAQAGVFSNLAFFQAGWTACVLGAAAGHPWTGTFLALLITVAHIVQSARPGKSRCVARQNLPGRSGTNCCRRQRGAPSHGWPATCVVNGNVVASSPERSGQKLPSHDFRERIQDDGTIPVKSGR